VLAKGIPGVRVFGSPNPVTMRANVLQITGDMSAMDKLLKNTGYNGYSPGRHREYHGVYHAPSRHYYLPPTDPTNEHIVLFRVDNCTAPKRTAESIGRDAAAVEEARSSGRSLAYQNGLSKKSGIKGHSLLFAPSEAMRLDYPHLSHLWSIGPAAAPYDVMHLFCRTSPRTCGGSSMGWFRLKGKQTRIT